MAVGERSDGARGGIAPSHVAPPTWFYPHNSTKPSSGEAPPPVSLRRRNCENEGERCPREIPFLPFLLAERSEREPLSSPELSNTNENHRMIFRRLATPRLANPHRNDASGWPAKLVTLSRATIPNATFLSRSTLRRDRQLCGLRIFHCHVAKQNQSIAAVYILRYTCRKCFFVS